MKNILAENLLRFGVKNLKENNMIRLKSLLKEQVDLTLDQETWLDKCTKSPANNMLARKWKLNNGLVNVDGDFECSKGITDFKGVKFGTVTGNFNCPVNSLTTLQGAPQSVGGDFECERNNITSLDGVPKRIGGLFTYPKNLGSEAAVKNELNNRNSKVSELQAL